MLEISWDLIRTLISSNFSPQGGHQQRLGAEDHGPAGEGGRAHSQTQSEEGAEAGVRKGGRQGEPSSVAIRTDIQTD